MTPAQTVAALTRIKAVPVIRAGKLEHATRAAQWLAEAGMSVVEMTLTTPHVFDGIAALRKQPELIVGAGTILSAGDARQAIEAGSQFLVTPCWVDGVIELAKAADIAVFIGTATASEIWRAHVAGATAVKAFPAVTLGGPTYLKQVRAVFPDVKIMPTGGVSLETAADYLAAGAFCVGLGSELAPQKLLETGDKAAVVDRAKRLLAKLSPPTMLSV